jgi:mRNA interferase MazF
MKKGEIWLASLPSNTHHEQSGFRPVVVLAETDANIALIIPFTSNLNSLNFSYSLSVDPSKTNSLKEKSALLIFQLRAIDKRRLRNRIGEIENKTLAEIDAQIKNLLKL